MDLAELLQRDEGKTLEFKRDLSSPEKVLQTLIAFANTAGGVLVIGVENRTKRVRGVSDPLLEEERLASLITDRIEPRLVPNIEIVAWRSAQVLVVEVYPSSNRPHWLKNLGPENGVFVRIGSTNRRADALLIQEMRRMARNETYDESPLAHLDSEALDFRVAAELFPQRRSLGRPALETLRALTRHERRLVPTVGGLLLFGKEPEREFPDAWIQCGRFAGTDKSVLADSVECHGVLTRMLEAAYEFIKKHAVYPAKISGLKRTDTPSIPLRAVRELLVNAVVHADYAQQGAPVRVSIFTDRVEIENPGVLLAGLTVEDIKHGVSKLRNRVIGRVFKELGYIEQWGSGIQRAMSECRQAGLPEPVFQEMAYRFRAIISLKAEQAPEQDAITETVRQALLAPENSKGLSTHQLAMHAAITPRAMRTRLAKLVASGLVTVVGKNSRDPQRKYHWRST
jgi:predicted HTH transcriptional regulator